MARQRIDEAGRHVEVDLHAYPVWEAMEVADSKVREAWENGYASVTLIHGSPWIGHHAVASVLGRGGIKWGLRGKLARGEWMEWAFNRRSRRHDIGSGAMTLALRKNPAPRPTPVWEPMAEEDDS